MPALFIFLLKVNAALLVFCAGYYFVLRHLTFYTLNRIYLVSAILFASIYPKINLTDFVQRHQQIAKPVQAVVLNWQAPVNVFVKPLEQPNYWQWAEAIFWLGAALLTLRLLVQLYSLYKLYRNSTAAHIYGHHVRVMKDDASPFSFWKSIYVNPARHEPADLKSILLHEQVHVSEWHTLDILLAELSTIFYWFNPGVWLMKKAIRENIEFITDNKILQNGADTKQYQYSLLNVSFAAAPQGIVNHFNISTIKKRIIMMNVKRSSKFNLTRYVILVPVAVALLLVFSVSRAALVKKSDGIYKALDLTTNKNNMTAISISTKKTGGPKLILKSSIISKANSPKQKAVNIFDTLKNGNVFISTTERTDSLNYVINGVKSTKADFKTLDPDKIYSIELVPAERASTIIDKLDKKHQVLFITTDDSETGKKFKEKIDKLNDNYPMAAARNLSSSAHNSNRMVIVSNLPKGQDSPVTTWDSNDGPELAAAKVEAYTITPKNGSKPSTVTINRNYNNGATLKGFKTKIINAKIATIDTIKDINGKIILDTIYNVRPITVSQFATAHASNTNGPEVFTTFSPFNNSKFKLSDKMIIINGKVATEADLKKLSAFDIDRMVFKTNEETKELYGDKAKNGIVFIVTKKK
jgi:bla regulator protein blaR1